MPTLAILVLALVAVVLTAQVLVFRCRLAAAEARAERRNGEFLIRSLSHELRTPLTAMIGYAEVARQPSLEEDHREVCLARMIDSGQRLVRLVNDVFDLSQLQDGGFRVHPIDCRLDDVLDDAVAAVRPEADRKGLLVATRVDDDVPQQVRLDPSRVAQVLRIVMDNAVKFTRRGHVGVRVELRGGTLTFEIHDTGPGVAARAKSGLFKVGRSGDQSPTRAHGGTGLGLSLAARLAREMDGALVHDERESPGARFRLELPYVPAVSTPDPVLPQRTAENVAADAPRCGSFRGRVLVVDDARDNQVLVRHVLQQFGLEADVADNGRLALRALEGQPYDLVLMDMQMPVLDGYAATGEIRGQGSEVPVVALTAHAFAGERERCLEAGCDDFITKPLDRKKLGQVLGKFLQPANAD